MVWKYTCDTKNTWFLCTCNLLVYPDVIVALIRKKGLLLNFYYCLLLFYYWNWIVSHILFSHFSRTTIKTGGQKLTKWMENHIYADDETCH